MSTFGYPTTEEYPSSVVTLADHLLLQPCSVYMRSIYCSHVCAQPVSHPAAHPEARHRSLSASHVDIQPRRDKDRALGVYSGSSYFSLLPMWNRSASLQNHQVPRIAERCREDQGCGSVTFSKHGISTHTQRTAVLGKGGEDTSIFGLVVGNAACAAPGAGCGLSKPITSLPLPSAWGSMNLSQEAPWLPPIQQWIRMGMGRNTDWVNCPPWPKMETH